jgi:DNA N-6-adenine-methyltransferase (Dam)
MSRYATSKKEIPAGYTRDDYCTPKWIADLIGPVDLDPCSNAESHVRAYTQFRQSDDGLSQDWRPYSTWFVNYPYSKGGPWFDKALRDIDGNQSFIFLTPGSANRNMRTFCSVAKIKGYILHARILARRVSFEIAGSPVKGNDSHNWMIFGWPSHCGGNGWAREVMDRFEKEAHLL